MAEDFARFSDVSSWQQLNKCGVEQPEEGELRAVAATSTLRLGQRVMKGGIFGWQSPPLELEPGRYYRFAYRGRASCRGFWEAQFAGAPGQPVEDYHTGAIDSTDMQWRETKVYFRAKHGRPAAHLIFWPLDPGIIEVAEPSLAPVEKSEAWGWFRGIMASVPPVTPNDDDRRSIFLTKTRDRLRAGKRVSIAVYGDSIGFDVGNMPHTCGMAGSGWAKLSRPDLLQTRLLPVKPDLVLTLSISNQPGDVAKHLPVLINAVRKECGSEFLLLTNHLPPETFGDRYDLVAAETRSVARAERCQLLDLHRLLPAYLRANGLPFEWLLRDRCHFGEKGRAVVLQMLMDHLGA
jgi:hypothetical protein